MTQQANHYDHENYTVQRIAHLSGRNTASVVAAAFLTPVNVKVNRVGAIAVIAGTAATNSYAVRNNTTSISTLGLTTNAALSVTSADLAGATVTAGTSLNFLKGADATGIADFFVEYGVLPGQALSV